ncbi:MAG: DUF2125 domain-containing protein [Kiloniellales bacterium]|nr:DUF2125 domain-containing protein [Kiloniellales bacterium]
MTAGDAAGQADRPGAVRRWGRRLLAAAALLGVLLAATYAGYWFWAAGRAAQAIAEWQTEQEARGYAIEFGRPEIGGFPGRARTVFAAPRIAAPAGWRYSGTSLAASADPWKPFEFEIDLTGRHRFDEAGPEARSAELALSSGRSQVTLQPHGGLERIFLETGSLQAELSEGALPPTEVSAERLSAILGPLRQGDGEQPESLDFRIDLGGLVLPDRVEAVLGQEIERLEIDATLKGRLEAGGRAEDRAAALAAWRDAGGLVQVHRLVLTWGPLYAEGRGTLTLDPELRPSGKLRARFHGLDQLVDLLAEAGLIEAKQARAARGVLALLGVGVSRRGSGAMSMPVNLTRGRLYLGPLAVARLSPVL